MGFMFSGCSSLTNLDLSNFDTSKVTNMGSMFSNCNSLTNLDLSNFDTSQVTTMNGMFHECGSLTNLDLSSLNLSNNNTILTSYTNMFQNLKTTCQILVKDLEARNWVLIKSNGHPESANVIIKD